MRVTRHSIFFAGRLNSFRGLSIFNFLTVLVKKSLVIPQKVPINHLKSRHWGSQKAPRLVRPGPVPEARKRKTPFFHWFMLSITRLFESRIACPAWGTGDPESSAAPGHFTGSVRSTFSPRIVGAFSDLYTSFFKGTAPLIAWFMLRFFRALKIQNAFNLRALKSPF